jgi:hypothetical protein
MGWTSEEYWFYSWQEQRQRVETGSGAHLGYRGLFPVDKANARSGDHSSVSGAEFKNNASCVCTPLYALMCEQGQLYFGLLLNVNYIL